MDLGLKPEHKAFADEVRAFARKNLSPATRAKTFSGKHYDRDDHMAWQQALGRQGWLAYTWPKKYGGPGWDVTQRFLFENVLAEEGAPRIIPFGPKMVGPVIYTFGSDAQKERFLPGIRQSTVAWCQGYSEPGAGSDLANLRTKAVRANDRGRSLHRQRPEDLDLVRALGRLDLLPGAHQPGRQGAGRHLLPADRHEDAGRHGAADHHAGRRASRERRLPRQCEGPGREPHRQGRRGLDLRQVPAGQRAAGHRRGAGLQARRAQLARHRAQRAGEWRHPGARSGLHRPDRRPRPAGPGAGDERAARALGHGRRAARPAPKSRP